MYLTGPETERLILRAFKPEDAASLFLLNSDPDVLRYTGEPPLESEQEALHRIETYPDFKKHGFGRWACVYRPEMRIIGFAGLKVLEELGEVDLGYRFLPDYWGLGLATEASASCLRFGFQTLELDRIIGLVLPDNTASIRVLKKVGMTLDGEIEYEGQRVLQYVAFR